MPKSIRPIRHHSIETAIDFMQPFPALIQKRELQRSPNVHPLALLHYKQRHKPRVIAFVLPVGIEIDRPLTAADGELLGGDVLAEPYPFREGIAVDGELVRSDDHVGGRDRRSPRRRRGIRWLLG